jgi:hypothetical protein
VSPLGVLVPNIFLSEEVWDVSRVGLGFSSNQNLGFLRKSKVRASFHYFFGVWFDGCSWCPGVLVPNILSEEVWDVSQ